MTDLPARRVVNEAGRSEYRVTETGIQIVSELAARGCSVVTIARVLGMGKDAFKSVRQRQPEVEEALEQGRAVEHDALVSNLRTAADGGNIVANIFLLKARHQYREGEALEANVNLNIDPGGVLVVPPKMTVEEFIADTRRREAGEGPDVVDVTPQEARRGD